MLFVYGNLFTFSRESVPVDITMVYARESLPFVWICMSFCIAGFQLVLQACLALFDLYNTYI
jgi:hypothetical protein